MPPGKLDLDVYQGDTFKLALTFTTGGAPLDITGTTFAAHIRTTTADADGGVPPNPPSAPLAAMVATITDGPAGKALLTIPHTDTEKLRAGVFRWDLQGVNGGETTTYLAGEVRVTAEVTRP